MNDVLFECFCVCRSSFGTISSAADQLASLADQMSSVEQVFTAAGRVGTANIQPAITQSLQYVRGQVEACVTEFTTWKSQLLCLEPQPAGECTGSYIVRIEKRIMVTRCQLIDHQDYTSTTKTDHSLL